MSELTKKQKNVLDLIDRGCNIIDLLSSESKLSKAALTPVLNALLAKNLIVKSDDGVYAPVVKIEESEDLESYKPIFKEWEVPSASHFGVGGTIRSGTIKRDDIICNKSIDRSIKVIVPYVKSEGLGEGLKYALRSWDKYFKEGVQIIVVGDHEDWFGPELIHIPHEPHLITEVCNCPVPAQILNPQADITHKVLTAITAEGIQGGFILASASSFLLGDTSLADIEFLKSFSSDLAIAGQGKGLYAQNCRLTAKALLEVGLPTVRYGANAPVALDAEKLVEIIEKYNATEHGYLIESLFNNEEYPTARPVLLDGGANDPILASAFRSDISREVIDKVFAVRKFLNCDSKGFLSIEQKLREVFPEKSTFEI